MGKKNITVSAIARESGVSPATVSRVLNHRDQVKKSTIQAVEQAMFRLGYEYTAPPEQDAFEQKVIVVNLPNNDNYFYQEVLQGARASASGHGIYLLSYESMINRGTIRHFCSLLQRVKASGVILFSKLDVDLLQQIHAIAPLVQCCEFNPQAPYPYVSIDDYTASKIAIEHLIASGRNKIAFINGPLSFKYSVERLQGYMDTMKNFGISIMKNWIIQLPEINYDMAYSAAFRVLKSETAPNAFFCISDIFAMSVIRAASRSRLRVPQDIMVVGFDNINLSTMTVPSITTISQPKFQMGYSACEMIVEHMANPLAEPNSILLDTELLVRESTSVSNISQATLEGNSFS